VPARSENDPHRDVESGPCGVCGDRGEVQSGSQRPSTYATRGTPAPIPAARRTWAESLLDPDH
jgi:hypothetical protein